MQLPPPKDEPDYARVRWHDIRELWDTTIQPHVAAAYQARLTVLRGLATSRLSAGASILDVGCAQGTLGLTLAEAGFRVTLLDIRAGHIAYAKARHTVGEVEFRVGRIEEQTDLADRFAFAYFTETIEHIRSPASTLRAIMQTLHPGGFLAVTTPNADYLFNRLPTYGSASQHTVDATDDNSADGSDHRFLYSREELVAVSRAVGFELERHEFLVPFWLEGNLKTRYGHYALHRILMHPLRVGPRGATGHSALARRLYSSQFILLRRPADSASSP
jgi:2-polyprenyl-3-methyl-5-hydroxy-6-metoxy-1,4-benzoquinol methylase